MFIIRFSITMLMFKYRGARPDDFGRHRWSTISSYIFTMRRWWAVAWSVYVTATTAPAEFEQLTMLLKRIRAHCGHIGTMRPREPIPVDVIEATLSSQDVDLGIRAATAAIYATMARPGEFVPTQGSYDPGRHTTVGNFTILPEQRAIILSKWRKTDSDRPSNLVLMPLPPEKRHLCPVALLLQHWTQRRRRRGPLQPRDPPFTLSNGRPVSSRHVTAALRNCARHRTPSVDPTPIVAAALRTTAASRLHAAGVDTTTIVDMGGWSSDAFRTYIRPELTRRSAQLHGALLPGTSRARRQAPDQDHPAHRAATADFSFVQRHLSPSYLASQE